MKRVLLLGLIVCLSCNEKSTFEPNPNVIQEAKTETRKVEPKEITEEWNQETTPAVRLNDEPSNLTATLPIDSGRTQLPDDIVDGTADFGLDELSNTILEPDQNPYQAWELHKQRRSKLMQRIEKLDDQIHFDGKLTFEEKTSLNSKLMMDILKAFREAKETREAILKAKKKKVK